MRYLVVFTIFLTGCFGSGKPSKRTATSKPYVTKWKPAPDPAPKPPPPPVKPPPPPAPPPIDPALEERKAELRRKRAREKGFTSLPAAEKRRITLTIDALAAKGLDQLGSADLAVIKLHPKQFPEVSPTDVTLALATLGDEKGACDHLASLGIDDPDKMLRVRAAFGLAPDATCDDALAAAEEISRVGLGGVSNRVKAFVARNPELFPLPH